MISSVLGTECDRLERFHVEVWNEDMSGSDQLAWDKSYSKYFPSLTDVKIKCEVYVDTLPPAVVDNILDTTSQQLTIFQV